MVRVMCKVLVVSESGYYQWKKRPVSKRAKADKELSTQIEPIFEQSRQTYGSPRLKAALKLKGISCSKKQVARLMRLMGLVSCHRRKKRKVNTTDSSHTNPVAPNRLNRDFTATGSDQKWVGDITGVWTKEGWLYLAALVDIYSKKVVGWSMGANRDEALVERALLMALERRNPCEGLLHHTVMSNKRNVKSR